LFKCVLAIEANISENMFLAKKKVIFGVYVFLEMQSLSSIGSKHLFPMMSLGAQHTI
jgi:hypothetical protein